MGISDIFEQRNTNFNLRTLSGSYLKLLVFTTYDGSDSSETVSPRIVNDLHAVVSEFFQNLEEIKLQCSCYIF